MTAAERILSKALVGSGLDTRQWSGVQAGLRDRAFFMAQVEEARILHTARQGIADILQSGKSQSEVRRDIRSVLEKIGYNPDSGLGENEQSRRGTIKDLLTKRRLDVMIETNVRQARGYAEHLRATTDGALRAFPAFELIRVKSRRQPRDWDARWTEAARAVGYEGVARGAKIALKTSPIWTRISRFGNPFPPFDFNSGMGVDDVPRSECIRIGLIDKDTPPQKQPEVHMNGSLQSEVPFTGKSKEYLKLVDTFGDQITHEGGSIKWRGNIIRDAFERGDDFEIRLGKPTQALKRMLSSEDLSLLKDKSFTLKGDWLDNPRVDGGTHRDHFEPREKDPRNIPLTSGDLDLIPTLWRTPDHVVKGGYTGSFTCEVDTIDGGILRMVVDATKTPKIKTLYKRKSGLGSGGLA